jgi:hypothetical protein
VNEEASIYLKAYGNPEPSAMNIPEQLAKGDDADAP